MDDDNAASYQNGLMYGPDHYYLSYFDVAAKLIYPFQNGWSVFAKLGAAYVHQDVYNQVLEGQQPEVDTDTTMLRPLVGAGVSFKFYATF